MAKKGGDLCRELVFDTFYRKHSEALYSFMYYRCGNKDNALDLVQEAFLKVWNKCAEITLLKAKSYLFQTANNLFLNEVRHQKIVLDYSKSYPNKDMTNQNPEYLLREKEFDERLKQVISELPEGQREVFLLNRINGKKYAEIAALLNISVKAVEKRMSGALQKLRSEFEYF